MNAIESFLYEISRFFLTPVLVLLSLMFVYALFCLGMLLFDSVLRAARRQGRRPLAQWLHRQPDASPEALELQVLRQLEMQRIVSRIAPMLGLVATMIPMGPALIAVAGGNTHGMAQNLVVAFAAVIVALLSASITFAVHSVRRRWLLEELDGLLQGRESAPAAAEGKTQGAAYA